MLILIRKCYLIGQFLQESIDFYKLGTNHHSHLNVGQCCEQAALSLIIKLTFDAMLVFSITNHVKRHRSSLYS